METAGLLFYQPYLLLILSTLNAVILFAAVAAIITVVFGIYRSKISGYNNVIDAMQQQINDMQQHLEYANREETKARADAKRSAQARDKLLASLTHEIRTPMNGILGMTLLLEETSLGPDQKDYIDTIISTGKTLLSKVDEVMANDELEQSKIDRTINAAQQKATYIGSCVEEVIETFSVKAAEKQMDLLYCIDDDVPAQALADIKRLKQVLTNLVEYTMQCLQTQQVVVGVHIIKYDRADISPTLGFTVGATAAANAAKAGGFLATGQLIEDAAIDNGSNEKMLGLVISKKLVEEMGGKIRTTAAKTDFIFTIPLTAVAVQKTNDGYTLKEFEEKRVIVVSQNLTAACIIAKQLQQWKMVPVIAGDAAQALQIAEAQTINLVITEMYLPGQNGMQLASAIKNKFDKLPVLLLNPLNDTNYKQYEGAAEITVINKPLKQHILFNSILSNLHQNKKAGQIQDMSVKKLSADFSTQYPLRILVAEDNEVNQKWALKILAKMGYEADIAANGHIALDMVGKAAYDLILMDVQMPEMDGMEATKMIRVCLNKQPVIIAMTANAMHGDRMACMQAGMDDYISKPVQLGELVNTLEKWAIVITEKKIAETEDRI
jgi:CheY-like chemotaxis protein/nitrogen-specific signal transduction histidine kinase